MRGQLKVRQWEILLKVEPWRDWAEKEKDEKEKSSKNSASGSIPEKRLKGIGRYWEGWMSESRIRMGCRSLDLPNMLASWVLASPGM